MSASLENVWNFKKVEVGARPKTHLNWVLTRTRYALLTTHAILTQNVIIYYLQTHQATSHPTHYTHTNFNSCLFWSGGIGLDLFYFYCKIPAIFGQWRNLLGSIFFVVQILTLLLLKPSTHNACCP